MAILYDVPVDLPKSYYAPIGQIIARSSLLEFQIRNMSWRMFGLSNKAGRVLTIGMGSRVLTAMINPMAKYWAKNKTSLQMLNSFANNARRCFRERNTIAHGFWGHPLDKPTQWRFHQTWEPDQRVMPVVIKKGPRELWKLAHDFRALNVKAEKLLDRLTGEHST